MWRILFLHVFRGDVYGRGFLYCFGLAVLLTGLSGTLSRIWLEPAETVLVCVIALMLALPLHWRTRLPAFGFGDLLRPFLVISRNHERSQIISRCFFLALVPMIICAESLFNGRSLMVQMFPYLLFVAVVARFTPSPAEQLVSRMVIVACFVFVASCRASEVNFALLLSALPLLLQGVSFALFQTAYPNHSSQMAIDLASWSWRRNLTVAAIATVTAAVGTVLCYHGNLSALTTFNVAPAAAEPGGQGPQLSSEQMLPLLVYSMLVVVILVIGMKLVATFFRPKSAMDGAPVAIGVAANKQSHDLASFWRAGSRWRSERRRIIRAYLRIRKAADKRDIACLPGQTPHEFAVHLGRKVSGASSDMTRLTDIFMHARYGEDEPSTDLADEATLLAKQLTKTLRHDA